MDKRSVCAKRVPATVIELHWKAIFVDVVPIVVNVRQHISVMLHPTMRMLFVVLAMKKLNLNRSIKLSKSPVHVPNHQVGWVFALLNVLPTKIVMEITNVVVVVLVCA